MRRFQFRLARLAQVRAVEEELARQTWQAAEAAVRAAEERVQWIQNEIIGATERLRRAQGDRRLAPLEVLSLQSSNDSLLGNLDLAWRRVDTLRIAVEEARRPWQVLRSEIEGLSRLEEKARATHRREAEREEMKQMDQIASERAARSSASEAPGGTSDTTPDSRWDAAEAQCTNS